MDRVFLDANVLFSAAYRPESRLLRLWNRDNVALISSLYAVEEARVNLHDKKAVNRLLELSESVQLFEAGQTLMPRGVSLPTKDAPVLLAAIASGSSHLITGDVRHFGPYFGRKIEGVFVLRPAAYLRTLAR